MQRAGAVEEICTEFRSIRVALLEGIFNSKNTQAEHRQKLHRVFAWRITGVVGDCTEFGQAGLHRISGVSGWGVQVLGKIAQSCMVAQSFKRDFGE